MSIFIPVLVLKLNYNNKIKNSYNSLPVVHCTWSKIMNNSSIFQNYCENAIKKLKNDDIEQFKLTKDDETRIKIIYNVAKTMEINYNDNGKDFNRAQEEKISAISTLLKKITKMP